MAGAGGLGGESVVVVGSEIKVDRQTWAVSRALHISLENGKSVLGLRVAWGKGGRVQGRAIGLR